MRKPLAVLLVTAIAPAFARAQFDPPVATDTNPAPNVIEVQLSAGVGPWQYLPGVDTTVWAYSDDAAGGSGLSVPGPTIEANVGDTLIVHFTNNLPDPTTIHWHGIEVPADMDGSHISQRLIEPGETFVYQFPLLREGLYWYHPHVRPYDQVEKGLYGCVLVKDPARESIVFANKGERQVQEHIVVFDDVLLDTSNEVVPAFSFTDPLQSALYQLNGRVGNHLLVNGRKASTVSLEVTNGAIQRWRCLNAANTTIARVDIHATTTSTFQSLNAILWELGADGGFNDKPFQRFPNTPTGPSAEGGGTEDHPGQALVNEMFQGILLFPGQRMDVAFTPIGPNGMTVTLQQNDWFRGRHIAVQPGGPGTTIMLPDDPLDGFYPDLEYFTMTLVGPSGGLTPWVPSFSLPYPPVTPSQGVLPVTFGHGLPNPMTGDVPFFAQAIMSGGQMTPLPAAAIGSFEAYDVDVGETWTWEVTNLTHGDHPFHLHGFFFELIEYEWEDDIDPSPALNFSFQPLARRQLLDTIRIPARLGQKGTSRTYTRLRVHFDDTGREGKVAAQGELPTFRPDGTWTSGGWLFHCHVLEHSARGMLSVYEVRDPTDPFVLLGKGLAGDRGLPYLTGEGGLTGPVSLHLANARPNAQVFLLSSHVFGNRVFHRGGTLVPGMSDKLDNLLLPARTNDVGVASWHFGSAAQVPTYSQALVFDPSSPNGLLTFSNAVRRVEL